MKILLFGATGNVGSRLLRALIAHSHTPVLYLRDPSKLPQDILDLIPSDQVIKGSATDRTAISSAIKTNDCDAVVSAAGLAGQWSVSDSFPAIFKTIVEATASVGRERGRPLRCWMMGGFTSLDFPEESIGRKGVMIVNYLPLFPDHRNNYAFIKSIPEQELAWSLLCANDMKPAKGTDATMEAKARTAEIYASVDSPPHWRNTLAWIPRVGTYLNLFANVSSYFSTLEQAAEVIARDLEKGLESEFVNHRVGFCAKK